MTITISRHLKLNIFFDCKGKCKARITLCYRELVDFSCDVLVTIVDIVISKYCLTERI